MTAHVSFNGIDLTSYLEVDMTSFNLGPAIQDIYAPVIQKMASRMFISNQLLGIYTRVELLHARRAERRRNRFDRRLRRAISEAFSNARFAIGKWVLGGEEYRLHRDCDY